MFFLFDSHQGALTRKIGKIEIVGAVCNLLTNQHSQSGHKTPQIWQHCLCYLAGKSEMACNFQVFLFNFKSDTRNNPNNTAIFVDTCSWFFFDKRALGIWCNGIVPYKPNEFLMHRAHTITVRTRLTRQHHKHFSCGSIHI